MRGVGDDIMWIYLQSIEFFILFYFFFKKYLLVFLLPGKAALNPNDSRHVAAMEGDNIASIQQHSGVFEGNNRRLSAVIAALITVSEFQV